MHFYFLKQTVLPHGHWDAVARSTAVYCGEFVTADDQRLAGAELWKARVARALRGLEVTEEWDEGVLHGSVSYGAVLETKEPLADAWPLAGTDFIINNSTEILCVTNNA